MNENVTTMTHTPVAESVSQLSVDQAIEALLAGQEHSLAESLADLPGGDIADLLEALLPEQRIVLWRALPDSRDADILPYLHDEARVGIIKAMEEPQIVAALEGMDPVDLADVIDELPADIGESILESLDTDNRQRVASVLAFDEGTAGRLMTRDAVSVRTNISLAVVLRWLRRHDLLPPHTDALMVVDEAGRFLGKLPMDTIVTGDPDRLVSEAMTVSDATLQATAPLHDVAILFDRRDIVSAAIVDEVGVLLGRITIEDALDVIQEEASHAYLKSAGLDQEDDLFAPVVPSARRRGVWLGLNLVTVFAAAWVIGLFEAALSQLVALAVLMPVVASMGGIAGSQTLTLTIRGMAKDQIAAGNIRWLATKEVAVGLLNGVVWSVVVAIITYLWFQNVGLAVVIAVAILVNLLAAAMCGVGVPLVLKKLGIDPALSGAVILTTVTDVIGFLSFLGMATLFLL